jgi:hypothetical protein
MNGKFEVIWKQAAGIFLKALHYYYPEGAGINRWWSAVENFH